MEHAGQVNQYVCEKCGHRTTTINAIDGTTPFIMGKCRSLTGCDGMAMSAFYRVDQQLRPTHEWYRPAGPDLEKLDKATREYVENGCLLIRRVAIETLERFGYRTRFA